MSKIHPFNTLTLLALSMVLWAACRPQKPIEIIITVSPETTIATTSGVIPTIGITPLATAENLAIPTIDSQSVPTFAPRVEQSPTPIIAAVSQTPSPVGTVIGAIVDENYTLPPTSTPRPTQTDTPTVTASSTVPPPPSATPITTPFDSIPRLDRSQMGIQLYYNIDVPGWEHVMGQTGQLRLGWVKFQANWKFLQPNSPQDFDQAFRLFQLHVQTADRNGFQVLISVAKAPDWARNINRNESGPPDNPQDLVNFINLLLDKIGPNIDAIEVWNEPNLAREWTGGYGFNGAGYMQLFRPAYDAIRSYSPNMAIVTAGLAPTGNTPGQSINDRDFLRQMYDAGLAAYPDIGIGTHPYSWGNPPDVRCCNAIEGQGWDDDPTFFFANTIDDYRDILVQYGHSVQMWATEFGWATWEAFPNEAPQPWMTYNSPQQQSDYTVRAFQIGQERPEIGPMILWNLNFAIPPVIEERNEIAGYSLLYPTFNPEKPLEERPLYWALANRP